MSLLVVGVGLDYVLVASDSRSTRELPDGEVLVHDARQKLFVVGDAVVGLSGDNGVADAMAARFCGIGPAVAPHGILALAALAAADVGWRSGQPNRTCSVVFADCDNGPRAFMMGASEWFRLRPETECRWVPPPGRCATHLVRRDWREGIGRDEAAALFTRFIEETAAVNGLVGGPVQLAWVDADGARLDG